MVEIARRPIEPQDGELLIGLGVNGQKPLLIEEVGEFFQSIAKDYRRISRGHELILYRVIEGSLWTIFRDATGLAAGVNHIIKFSHTIFDIVAALRSGFSVSRQKAGIKTINSIANIAVKSGARVEFVHRKSLFRGEEDSLVIEPVEALKIQATIARGKNSPPSIEQIEANPDQLRLGSELADLARSGAGKEILGTIARVLISKGASHLVEEIFSTLQEEGHFEAAQILENELRHRSGRASPPLLT